MKLPTDCLYRYTSKSHCNIVTGDFNCSGINWITLHSQNDGVPNTFLVISAGLSQCVNFSMLGRNTLDLVLTDDDQLINSVVADDAFGDSDHDTVKFVIILESVIDRTQELTDNIRFIWSKANFDLMDSYLSFIDWQTVLLNNPDALQLWSAVESTI